MYMVAMNGEEGGVPISSIMTVVLPQLDCANVFSIGSVGSGILETQIVNIESASCNDVMFWARDYEFKAVVQKLRLTGKFRPFAAIGATTPFLVDFTKAAN